MALRYTNPVWPHYFADPFVLYWRGSYYAYGTGEAPRVAHPSSHAPSVFTVLQSNDLTTWTELGPALVAPPGTEGHAFWAPEVAERDGRFHLYYSSAPAGRDELHRLHVAIAREPHGPFIHAGTVLAEEEGFSIDAHPFRDRNDGQFYLYFAKDFFEERTGTGIAVVRLGPDMLRADGASRPVIRANADWQVYQRNRPLYGREWAAWHTVEGPCVVQHAGRFYCFYSGGNWQTHDYGVSYAFADHPLGPWHHAPDPGPVVLRQIPGAVLGPGHHSYAMTPDGVTELLVYHAWDPGRTARRMCLDPLEWTDAGPRCAGPTTTPQVLGT
jgi:GH43 family beta-xylosidase